MQRYMLMKDMGKFIILAGIVLIIIGCIMYFSKSIPFLGRLPGDINIKKENYSIHFPIATSIIISIIISLILFIISKLR
jgi:hypothetical protein